MAKKETAFSRRKGMPFDDIAKENYARARAKGATQKVAAMECGTSYQTTLKWAIHPEMIARIHELREGANTFLAGVSKSWIMAKLKDNAELAADAGQFKSSTATLELMYKILCTDPDLKGETPSALPGDLTTAELENRIRQSLALPADTREMIEVPELDEEGEPVGRA